MLRFILLVFFFIYDGHCQACDTEAANRCWSLLSETLGNIIPQLDDVYRSPTASLQKTCRNLEGVFRCVGDKMMNCKAEDRLLYDTALSSGRFLCAQGKQGFIDHASCLFSSTNQKRIGECIQPAVKIIARIFLNVSEFNEIKLKDSRELCRLETKVGQCMYDSAAVQCGAKAATFIKRYLGATVLPIKSFLSCPQTYFGKPHRPSKTADNHNSVVPSTYVPHCKKYCYVFHHGLPTSLTQSYDDWCELNCRQGFCPPRICSCNCPQSERHITCQAVGLRFKSGVDGSQWCNTVCSKGFCPKHYCKCRVVLDN